MKRIVAAILFAAVAIAPLASAQPTEPFGWRGVAEICVTSATQREPVCETFGTRNLFDTEAACSTEMPALLQRVGARIRRDHPTWNVNARWACVQDRNAPNI